MTTRPQVPRVSVIIPTHNRAHLLPRAVDSVLAQTLDRYEILIIDDGSSDNTPDVIAGFSDQRIRSLRHDRNRGQSAAINTGIEHARGDYVGFLDDDDEWLPTEAGRAGGAARLGLPKSSAGLRLDGPGRRFGRPRDTRLPQHCRGGHIRAHSVAQHSRPNHRVADKVVGRKRGRGDGRERAAGTTTSISSPASRSVTMRSSFLKSWPGHISPTSTNAWGRTIPRNLSAAADFLRSHMSKFADELDRTTPRSCRGAASPRRRRDDARQPASGPGRHRVRLQARSTGPGAASASQEPRTDREDTSYAFSYEVVPVRADRAPHGADSPTGDVVEISCRRAADNPRVSVVVTTYNRAALLPRAVRSVLAQTYEDYELIIVDDCSTDDTPEVIRTFEDSRIRAVRHADNMGQSAAVNTGIRLARGEYIAFLDDDDEWVDQKLLRQVGTLDASDPRVGWCIRGSTMSTPPVVCGAPGDAASCQGTFGQTCWAGSGRRQLRRTWSGRRLRARSAGSTKL